MELTGNLQESTSLTKLHGNLWNFCDLHETVILVIITCIWEHAQDGWRRPDVKVSAAKLIAYGMGGFK